MTDRRLIEESFPLKEVSEHSKHEKNVRHGHISTLHIWPARRPLAACRAAIIAALMPDPGDEAGRHELNKKIAGITQWKTENGPALDYFRREIRAAFGGRAPRVLDMFAGGGAIPLEAMRLGCDVTAIDYNPVAWFILKCTLEFPQRLAGQTWPLPDDESIRARLKGQRPADEEAEEGDDEDEEEETDEPPHPTPPQSGEGTESAPPPEWGRLGGGNQLGDGEMTPAQMDFLDHVAEEGGVEGNLADHVRYWGEWVLEQARQELAAYYPTVDGQPTVAYLWARTVPCPDPKCGCVVPLLKTLWLCKKAEKTLPDTPENRARADFLRIKRTKNTRKVVINARRALRLHPPARGQGGPVRFEVWTPGPKEEPPPGTMSGSTTRCPSCGTGVSGDYIKECGHTGKLDAQMTAVVVDAGYGKEYRLPIRVEAEAAERAGTNLDDIATQIPFGLPDEPLQNNPRTLGVKLYGHNTWRDIFTPRQLMSLAVFVRTVRQAYVKIQESGYPDGWSEAIVCFLATILDRQADYNSTICIWVGDFVGHTFTRFALPITWDFCEVNPISGVGGDFTSAIAWVTRVVEHLLDAGGNPITPNVLHQSATEHLEEGFDAIITDPPYYQAIPYADLSDFFYVWLRRTIGDLYPAIFRLPVTPKRDELALRLPHTELKDDRTPEEYEQGMARAFVRGYEALKSDGRLVVVFAHKEPEAWETLVSALIQSGFTVSASWPIDTEREMRIRSVSSAALASSIWLVCRKRPENAGIGRYRAVRTAMEKRVTERLRYFWDIGLSGPDFVWAAVGPALEAYSSYSEVRRMDGSPFTVSDFLKEVRRMVADFSLGRILKGQSTEGLDEWTRYYLIHRSNFGLVAAPVGECILLTQGYGIDLNDLRSDRGYIQRASGSDVRLARWDERTRDDLGQPHPSGGLPMIDALHHLMRLWAAGAPDQLNRYVAEQGLGQNELFWSVAQAILEMAEAKSRERTLLEAIVAWGRGRGPVQPQQETFLAQK